MKFLIKVLLLVLAVSTIAATGVTRYRSHAKILTKKGFFCYAWGAAQGAAQGLLEKGCNLLGNKGKDPDAVKGLCGKLPMGVDFCKSAVEANASNIPKGCAVSSQKVVEWITTQCRLYLRNIYK